MAQNCMYTGMVQISVFTAMAQSKKSSSNKQTGSQCLCTTLNTVFMLCIAGRGLVFSALDQTSKQWGSAMRCASQRTTERPARWTLRGKRKQWNDSKGRKKISQKKQTNRVFFFSYLGGFSVSRARIERAGSPRPSRLTRRAFPQAGILGGSGT